MGEGTRSKANNVHTLTGWNSNRRLNTQDCKHTKMERPCKTGPILHGLSIHAKVLKKHDHIPAVSASLPELNFVLLKTTHLTVACMWPRWRWGAEVSHSVIVWVLRAPRRADLSASRPVENWGHSLLCCVTLVVQWFYGFMEVQQMESLTLDAEKLKNKNILQATCAI